MVNFIDEYLSDKENKLSRNSKGQYLSILSAYAKFICKPIDKALESDVSRYINHLKVDKGMTTGSIVVFTSVIRKFYNYMVERGYMDYNPVGRMRMAVGDSTPKDTGEVEAALDDACTNPRKYIEVMLTQKYNVKINELLSIRKEDIEFSERALTLKDGERARSIQISRDLSVILQCYTEYMLDTDLIFQLSERARLRDTRIASNARKPLSKAMKMRIPGPITPPFTTRRI